MCLGESLNYRRFNRLHGFTFGPSALKVELSKVKKVTILILLKLNEVVISGVQRDKSGCLFTKPGPTLFISSYLKFIQRLLHTDTEMFLLPCLTDLLLG